jgi:hypothetical protein
VHLFGFNYKKYRDGRSAKHKICQIIPASLKSDTTTDTSHFILFKCNIRNSLTEFRGEKYIKIAVVGKSIISVPLNQRGTIFIQFTKN